jgi:pyruvate/2-oxoglutarate dehydrogenase complex dihydrolipoamide dehydrogenase (E3) component
MFLPSSTGGDYLVPWCTFTDPELAHAGLTEAQARAEHGDDAIAVWRQDLSHSDRARADSAADGEIRIVTAKGRIVGAHALAPSAGELIGELALAIDRKLKITDLGSLVHVYPTIAIAIQQIAGEAAYASAEKYSWLVRSKA